MQTETGSIKITTTRSAKSLTGAALNSALLLTAALVLVILSGCATTQTAQLPPIPSGPDGTVESGKFVWIDLLTENTQDAAAFYNGLFGWQVKTWSGDKTYLVFWTQRGQIYLVSYVVDYVGAWRSNKSVPFGD